MISSRRRHFLRYFKDEEMEVPRDMYVNLAKSVTAAGEICEDVDHQR